MQSCIGAQLWCYAGALLAEVILEGVSRIKGRSSAIGRNAISADVQVPLLVAMHAFQCALEFSS